MNESSLFIVPPRSSDHGGAMAVEAQKPPTGSQHTAHGKHTSWLALENLMAYPNIHEYSDLVP